jgi:nucleoside-diphosphate-sugar epimerase
MDALMLEAMYDAGVTRVIYISSATVYQDMEGRVKEDMLDLNQDPHPTYAGVAWAKRAAEKLCWFWSTKYGMEIVIARSSNIYGPFAKFDPARSNFIPAIIRKAVDGMDPFELWGSPDVTRDVIYSEDFGSAVLALYNATDIKYDVFNLGYGQPVTVGSVVDAVLGVTGFKPSKVIYKETAYVTNKARVLDCSKINEVVGWKPEFTPLEGISKTIEWWRENQHSWKK